MSPVRDNPPSPRSSSGIGDSFEGTPDTRLTLFSPEESKSKLAKTSLGIPQHGSACTSPASMPGSSCCRSEAGPDRDPFTASAHACGTRLSPTALVFNPFSGSITSLRTAESKPVATALSTDLGLSRCLRIHFNPPNTPKDLKILLDSWKLYGTRDFDEVDETAQILFSDIRDACSALTKLFSSPKNWRPEYHTAIYNPNANNSVEGTLSNVPTGQVLVRATVSSSQIASSGHACDIVQRYLQSNGQLFAFVPIGSIHNRSFNAIAEYCDTSIAFYMINNCSHVVLEEKVRLEITAYQTEDESNSFPRLFEDLCTLNDSVLADHQQSITYGATSSIKSRMPPNFAMYPLMLQSPFVANVPYMLEAIVPPYRHSPASSITQLSAPYQVAGPFYHTPPSPTLTSRNSFSPSRSVTGADRLDGRRQNAIRVARSSFSNAANHHNYVDIKRIRDGIDVRTTIMLRNIPNKVDQSMLKRIIDESSWGKYDFMYLRIDFANDCNVGYAFINFVDPLDIIDFVEARGNQRWNCFKSDKVAEISYATIQGKDCLVQKFRNSSVMLESPHYRPKLYFTSNGPMPGLAGQEEPFPEPDNQSKMKRSCENAEHVGLFTPNAGQHYRDEQRRRRSQYDRGTRLAALEEYDYDSAATQLYGGT